MAGATVPKYHILAATLPCLLALLAGCVAPRRQVRLPDSGRIPFQNHCAACHQYDGQGMGDAPALAGSPWVTGPESRLIRIVLHGVRGPMVVDGKPYDQEMPGFSQILSDTELAALLSYVRIRFGALREPVTAEMVSRERAANRARTQYWRVDELDQP